jgi:hypothetical protein
VLTYNVRAAGELVERLEHALGVEAASRSWVHMISRAKDELVTLAEYAEHAGAQRVAYCPRRYPAPAG